MSLDSSILSGQIVQNSTADSLVTMYLILLRKICELRQHTKYANDSSEEKERLRHMIAEIECLQIQLVGLNQALDEIVRRLEIL